MSNLRLQNFWKSSPSIAKLGVPLRKTGKRIAYVTISESYKDGYRKYHDDNGFECIEYKWITIKYNDYILIVKVEPAPDDIQRSMRIESVNAYDYQVTLIYQN